MNDSLEVFLGKLVRELELKNLDGLSPDQVFREMEEWSSMKALMVLAFINIEYEKNYTAQQLSSCKTFRDVYNAIANS
ncbi:MAG: hypothetical protein IPP77_09370 [Bacteroidetes bacterium]|nr:hypothetical protein [Bacteroidota bacterium]